MKVKDYYCLLIRKKPREPIVIFVWNYFLDLDNEFVRDVFSFKIKQIRNNKVKQLYFKMIYKIIVSKENVYI